jgi:hypothetical protein
MEDRSSPRAWTPDVLEVATTMLGGTASLLSVIVVAIAATAFTREEVLREYALSILRDGDLCLLVTAGDVDTLVHQLADRPRLVAGSRSTRPMLGKSPVLALDGRSPTRARLPARRGGRWSGQPPAPRHRS